MSPERRQTLDYVMLMITAGVITGFCCFVIMLTIQTMRGEALDEEQQQNMSHIATSLIAIISLYIGAMLQKRIDNLPDEKEPKK